MKRFVSKIILLVGIWYQIFSVQLHNHVVFEDSFVLITKKLKTAKEYR